MRSQFTALAGYANARFGLSGVLRPSSIKPFREAYNFAWIEPVDIVGQAAIEAELPASKADAAL